jgi:putative flippase GtrA
MREREAADAPPRPSFVARHARSFPVYVGSGGVATASHYAFTVVAVELLSVAPVVATSLGFIVGAIVKYWLNYTVAFRSRAGHVGAIVRFAIFVAGLLALNTVVFELLHGVLGLHYLLAQAASTLALIPPGYLINRHWVFG